MLANFFIGKELAGGTGYYEMIWHNAASKILRSCCSNLLLLVFHLGQGHRIQIML